MRVSLLRSSVRAHPSPKNDTAHAQQCDRKEDVNTLSMNHWCGAVLSRKDTVSSQQYSATPTNQCGVTYMTRKYVGWPQINKLKRGN